MPRVPLTGSLSCSVDEFWHVPHFEKMLYDNPQLALTYLDAFRVTLARQRSGSSSSGSAPAATAAADAGAALASPIAASSSGAAGDSSSGVSTADEVLYDPRVYATVVRGVLDYLRRDMTHPEGGLYSAEVGVCCTPPYSKNGRLMCAYLPHAAVLVRVVLNKHVFITAAKTATRGCFGTGLCCADKQQHSRTSAETAACASPCCRWSLAVCRDSSPQQSLCRPILSTHVLPVTPNHLPPYALPSSAVAAARMPTPLTLTPTKSQRAPFMCGRTMKLWKCWGRSVPLCFMRCTA